MIMFVVLLEICFLGIVLIVGIVGLVILVVIVGGVFGGVFIVVGF